MSGNNIHIWGSNPYVLESFTVFLQGLERQPHCIAARSIERNQVRGGQYFPNAERSVLVNSVENRD
jgi:hypothetical protein